MLGEYEEEVDTLKKAISIDPNNAATHNNLGHAYNNLGRYEEAIQALKQSLIKDPNNAIAHNNLGLAYNNLSRYEEAKQCFEKVVMKEPNDPTVWTGLAVSCQKLKEYERSISCFKKAIQYKSDSTEVFWLYTGLSFLYATCPEAEFRNGKEAILLAEQACKLTDHKNHLCIAVLAAAYAESGDFNKAIECQKKAIDLVGEKEFTGIGIIFGKIDGQINILNVMQETPADMSGLTIGDVIEAVNGQNTKDMSIENVANIISDPIGTKVTLTVKRLGEDTSEDITLNRDRIANPMITEYEKRLAAYEASKPWRE